MEIIDAQIHEPMPPKSLGPQLGDDVQTLVNVELAREALDCVGVDKAIAFASLNYIEACVARYPERFVGVLAFDFNADDLEEQIVNFLQQPGSLGGRNMIGNHETAELRPEFHAGKYDRYWAFAEKHGLPLFFSTHGWAAEMRLVAERHPGLTIIIDHIGVSQSPVSMPRDDPWDRLDGLLGLAGHPNVNVKLCGAPTLSSEQFPYSDVWPHLHKVFEAFGPERIMWASDFTRMRELPSAVVRDGESPYAPFKQWKYYSDSLNFLRDTNEISQADKEWIFSKSVRRVLKWHD